jgi:hypothetical protein
MFMLSFYCNVYSGSMDDNINIDSTIAGSMNDNINIESTLE